MTDVNNVEQGGRNRANNVGPKLSRLKTRNVDDMKPGETLKDERDFLKNLDPPPSKAVMNDYLNFMYTTLSKAGSFQGVQKLYDAVLEDKTYRITQHDIKTWLEGNESYTMNRAVKKVQRRPRVVVSGIDDQFEADLASFDQKHVIEQNDGIKYLLVVIDVFSRYLWIKPLKNKSASNVVNAFKSIFAKSKRIPRRIRTDRGSEFTSAVTRSFFSKKGVHQMFTSNELQANYVERVIKTIKSKISRQFEPKSRNFRYIDKLQDVVDSYNKTWHSGIRSKPKDVNKKNESRLWWQMYWPEEVLDESSKKKKKKLSFRFKKDDIVRMSLRKEPFRREYDERWTGEVFRVESRFVREGKIPMYKLKDYSGDPVQGTFYQNELQKVRVSPDELFIVEKILKERTVKGQKEVKVKYLYWPNKFNEWIKKKDLIEL